ncbi:nitroreductase family deazaflavin-dependent oxidoreductase [Schumannella soli]|uniref:nitroreductase family deazaflavin-dependent oxidoreductase n=1 Tax=Schumannella soli TaxID=2590779 RepID=UPI00210276E1|nr:nitroreductase family deazaflavin-dependent oxidoreductase [Schumannella soli]
MERCRSRDAGPCAEPAPRDRATELATEPATELALALAFALAPSGARIRGARVAVVSFNDGIIDEFRANGGHVSTYGFGDGLVLLHTVGARSGEARVHPVAAFPADSFDATAGGRTTASSPEAAGWLVVASAAGADAHPAWFHNLTANPEVRVEFGRDGEVHTVEARATVLDRAERDAAYAEIVRRSPGFGEYEKKTDRVIPVVRVTRIG